MSTHLFLHKIYGEHEVPEGHVEQQARYHVVEQALNGEDFAHLNKSVSPVGEWDDVHRAHAEIYTDEIKSVAPKDRMIQLNADTHMGPHSLEAALRGVGGVTAAVDAVAKGDASNAFVAARPPGHHAIKGDSMGFCVFNNAAIAALHARAAHGFKRIAVVDFDVHHGNGTQDILETDENAFFASSHEWPQYPGTGRENDRGKVENCHNAPIGTGEGSQTFRKVWGDRLLVALSDFNPDFIVISAGFDAHQADPLGGLNLTEEDYAWVTGQIMGIAADKCTGRLISVMEGGYDLAALASSVATHVKTLASMDGHR